MAKLNFYLREKTKDGETPIILFISFNSNRLKYPTGKVIHPKFWNEGEQMARQVKDFPLAKIVNEDLKFLRGTAEKELAYLSNEMQRPPSIEELKKRLNEVLNPSEASQEEENRPPTFLELFDRFIQDSENGIRLTANGKRFDKRTIQKYSTVYDTLKDFGEKYHLTFDSIDKNFFTKFVAFLNKKKYTLNTVGKYIWIFRTILTPVPVILTPLKMGLVL